MESEWRRADSSLIGSPLQPLHIQRVEFPPESAIVSHSRLRAFVSLARTRLPGSRTGNGSCNLERTQKLNEAALMPSSQIPTTESGSAGSVRDRSPFTLQRVKPDLSRVCCLKCSIEQISRTASAVREQHRCCYLTNWHLLSRDGTCLCLWPRITTLGSTFIYFFNPSVLNLNRCPVCR